MASGNFTIFLKSLGKNFLYSIPVTVAVLDTFGYIAKVEGVSMQPALNPGDDHRNDYVFLSKWCIRKFDIKSGDIVALSCPNNPKQLLIKRVIATEGESVRPQKDICSITVPPGHCWVEGDHVNQSMDSNYFGAVSLGLIFAKASYIVWPPDRWRRLESHVPDRSFLNHLKAYLPSSSRDDE